MSRTEDNKGEVILREHEFDGIQEYDQKLPNWWLFTFYIAIVFFVLGWVAYYQLPLMMMNDHEQLTAKLDVIAKKKEVELERILSTLNDESLMEMSKDSTHTAAGKAIFDMKCSPCHGVDLSAKLNGMVLPGVPLNDKEWKYGGKPLEIMKTVTNGSPDITKGMIAWKDQLGPSEIAQVIAYILSKQAE
jgi:cytochrome c oxidase cbb3-type subunit 3